ncbi:hypothetical protein LXL04_025841 [Taraxacum kok-saghyz]
MRKKVLVSVPRLISTFTPTTFIRNSSTTSSFFPPQLDSYFQLNPRDRVYTYNRDIQRLLKSGSIDSALKLFDEMPTRDAVTWNIIISGHKSNGFSREALYFYSQMISQGFIETSSTFSTVLGVFSNERLYQQGLQVHNRAIVLGLSLNPYVGTALIDLYMNMNLINFAFRLFNDLPERNVATWNQLLRCFSEIGRSQKLELYFRMKREFIVPNPLTFCYLIRGFSNESLINNGKELHSYAIKLGFAESDLFVSNALVDFYSSCGNLTDTKKSFQIIPPNNVISWNSLVSIYAYNGLTNKALEIFSTMQKMWGKKPSTRSFVGLLNLSSKNSNILLGQQLHCFVKKLGFDHGSVYIQSALIDMYGKCNKIENSVSIYENVPVKTLEVCNSLMTSFAKCGVIEDVIELFGLMVDEGIGFDEVSLSITVNVLWKSKLGYGSLTNCRLLHSCAVKSGFDRDFAVSSSLIDSYSRFGHVKSIIIREWFDKMYLSDSFQNKSFKKGNDEIEFSDLPSWSSDRGIRVLMNVDSFGAVGDGVADDTKAFASAWKQACATESGVLLVPPDRTYLVNATRFKGPCAQDLIIQIDGKIVAPDEPKNWDPRNPRIWLYFSNLDGVVLQGDGVIDGSGKKWWAASCKKNKTKPCVGAPTALTIDQSSNIDVRGITVQNSQQMNFIISRSESIRVFDVIVSCPEESPNTDGIHLTASQNIVLQNCKIGTGDDCISIVSGCSNIQMKSIYCGPGHGISIGSLGQDNSTGFVTAIDLDTAFLKGTTNGLRIKTWQGGSGYVRAVRYRNVQMMDVANPIIIDQFYCDSPKSCKNKTSAVEISQIMFEGISGTTKSKYAMSFSCSDTVPCNNIVLDNINLRKSDGKKAETFCNSVMGFIIGYVQPSADCLMSGNGSFIELFEEEEVKVHSEL